MTQKFASAYHIFLQPHKTRATCKRTMSRIDFISHWLLSQDASAIAVAVREQQKERELQEEQREAAAEAARGRRRPLDEAASSEAKKVRRKDEDDDGAAHTGACPPQTTDVAARAGEIAPQLWLDATDEVCAAEVLRVATELQQQKESAANASAAAALGAAENKHAGALVTSAPVLRTLVTGGAGPDEAATTADRCKRVGTGQVFQLAVEAAAAAITALTSNPDRGADAAIASVAAVAASGSDSGRYSAAATTEPPVDAGAGSQQQLVEVPRELRRSGNVGHSIVCRGRARACVGDSLVCT
jgi:hypothetical protein